MPRQGNETRASILPSAAPSGLSILGSSYSPSDSLLSPPQIGVRVGDSMGDVVNAVKGVAFYTDAIGFGAPSSGLTQGMPLRPVGINYFMKTGQKCSNGADMYTYFEGIPRGDALGKRVQQAMSEMGLPPLRGLAPGIMEDAKQALNPVPLLGTLFGSGYPQCKQVTYMVGDAYGRIRGDDGSAWIDSPDTAVRRGDGLYYQTAWVQDTDAAGNPIALTREQWEAAPKTRKADGTPLSEGFTSLPAQWFNPREPSLLENPWVIGAVAAAVCIGLGFARGR